MLLFFMILAVPFMIMAALGLATITVQKSVSGAVQYNQTTTLSDNALINANPTVLAAQPATLTTRTDNTDGTMTMTNLAHGITTGQRLDIYFGTGFNSVQHTITAGSVSGTSVPISGGTGTVLPAQGSALAVGIPIAAPFNLVGNNLTALQLFTPSTGTFCFDNAAGADSYTVTVTGGFINGWISGDSSTNPVANDTITQVYMSHNNTAAAVSTMQAAALTH